MMSACLIVEAKITDPDRFMAYVEAVPVLAAQFGGEYVVLGGDAEILKDEWNGEKIVCHWWSDRASARRFWNSAEYAEARKLRIGTDHFRVMLVEGLNHELLV